jgi:hypothetical protein
MSYVLSEDGCARVVGPDGCGGCQYCQYAWLENQEVKKGSFLSVIIYPLTSIIRESKEMCYNVSSVSVFIPPYKKPCSIHFLFFISFANIYSHNRNQSHSLLVCVR